MAATVATVVVGSPIAPVAAAEGEVRITEWMYDGAGGEFVELTNVGSASVDLAGWTYDDDSADPTVGFDLSPLGVVEAGESVVFTQSAASAFRTDWGLGAEVSVLGGYTNNLGRADQINIFDGSDALVDRLTYGDQTVGGPRTTGASAWVSEAGLGADDATQWTLSTVGDAEGSLASTGGAVGSPGRSTLAPEPVGDVRITEWMYDGAGGEFVELTNVGSASVDLAGWTYDDDSADPSVGFDLSGLGVVEAGESVVFTQSTADGFRADWDLCAGVGVLGGYTNNLGRADQINIFDASDALVDRLTYGDQTVGGPRTTGASGWVSAAALGADDATQWTLSAVGDAEGSATSTGGAIGSPGHSTRATVELDPCDGGATPALAFDRPIVVGSIGDPTNPSATLTVTPSGPGVAVEDVTVTVASTNESVLAPAGVAITGDGTERTVTFAPVGRGTTTLTFTAEEPGGATSSTPLTYASSNAAPDPAGRYLHGVSDASSALDVGDGHVLIANDETNTIFLYSTAGTGAPVKTWTFSAAQLGTSSEVDVEGVARSGDTLVWIGSHGNNREGEVREERRTMFATTITGSGATTELTFDGRYTSLWEQLLEWDENDGHGLRADALGLTAAAAPGVLPNAPDGFNLEGFEFAPDGTTGYLGFRGPTVDEAGQELALIVPVTNILDLNVGTPGTTPAEFGDPILLDLGGRSIREVRRNDDGDYLISAGPSPSEPTWALYAWDGIAAHDAAFVVDLPAEDLLTGGTWESIATVPHPIATGATALLVTDSGDTNFYGTGQTKDLAPLYQKSYVQPVALAAPESEPPVAAAGGDQVVDLGDTVTLDGAGSHDPEGRPLDFGWTQTAGPAVTLDGATTATPTFTAPEGPATLTFELTVIDDAGLTDTDTVDVVVNGKPTAVAGPDQLVDPGVTVTLDGTGSSDPDGGDTLRYQWTQTFGPGVTLTGATTPTPTFTSPEGPAELRFRLIVRDRRGRFATDFVHIVVDGPPPTANAGPDRTVEASALVTLSGGDPVSGLKYQWNQTSGPAVTLSGAGTATATFTAPASPAELRFRLIVRDRRGRFATDFVTIAVEGAPPTANAGPDQTIARGQPVTLDGAGSSASVRYQWTQTYGPAVTLGGATTAHPTFVAPAGPAQVRFRLIVRDARGRFATDFVHITVTGLG
ncbi:MAG TPA: DUF3616 domain-containing protein [Iamia sp.]